jgi:regulator of sigma E protease
MESLFEGIRVVFFGVLMFSIIVVIHEAGHFTAARLFGLRVKEFMLGLPGPNISVTFKGTKFGVTPFLLGGYALIAGEGSVKENRNLADAYGNLAIYGSLDEDQLRAVQAQLGYDLEEALDILDAWGTVKRLKKKGRYSYHMLPDGQAAFGEPREITAAAASAHIDAERKLTFNAAPWYQRVIILAAGVVFNLLFAIIVFTTALMIVGTQVPTTTMASVVAESPAASAGIQAGDKVVEFDGQAVDSWESLTAAISAQKPGDKVTVTVERSGQQRDFQLALGANDNGAPLLGVSPASERQDVGFVQAFSTSVGFIGMVAVAIAQLFNPATFGDVVSQSTSVVGVAFEAENAASNGFLPFVVLAAALSISIGLMNLLPLPPLDGGKIVVETIERIVRRRIPIKIVNGISVAALALLIMLFLFVTNQDIQNYIIGG